MNNIIYFECTKCKSHSFIVDEHQACYDTSIIFLGFDHTGNRHVTNGCKCRDKKHYYNRHIRELFIPVYNLRPAGIF